MKILITGVLGSIGSILKQKLLNKNHIVFGIDKKTCITFDNFITEKPNFNGNCVDMEAVALAKICMQKQVKFLCFKYISDIIGEEKQENKWLKNYKEGKYLLKEAIENII